MFSHSRISAGREFQVDGALGAATEKARRASSVCMRGTTSIGRTQTPRWCLGLYQLAEVPYVGVAVVRTLWVVLNVVVVVVVAAAPLTRVSCPMCCVGGHREPSMCAKHIGICGDHAVCRGNSGSNQYRCICHPGYEKVNDRCLGRLLQARLHVTMFVIHISLFRQMKADKTHKII